MARDTAAVSWTPSPPRFDAEFRQQVPNARLNVIAHGAYRFNWLSCGVG